MSKVWLFCICVLLLFGTCNLTGCATTSHDTASQPSPTEDMNWVQKTGYYLWWPFQELIYGFAAGNPSGSL